MRTTKKEKAKDCVLVREMTKIGETYSTADNPGNLFLFSYGRKAGKTVAICGDPKGLRFLARLLNDVADVDQTLIPDRNCPREIGAHYHVGKRHGQLHPNSCELLVGRLDGKETGSHDWFLPLMDKE